MDLCKVEGCENEEVLDDLCRECFNAEYDDNYRADDTPGLMSTVVDGVKIICPVCEKRKVYAKGMCNTCYKRDYRKK